MESTESSAETHDGASSADSTGEVPPPLGMNHGVVKLELRRGESETDDPFVGTTQVEVTLLYRECLIEFYEVNPDWQQVGVEGSTVFQTVVLENALCTAMNPVLADCTVAMITQELAVTKAMTVTYDITGPLENRELYFGPLPTAQLAACQDGSFPIVRVGNNGSVRGFDASGTQIWTTEAFNPAEATTDQGLAITIQATRI